MDQLIDDQARARRSARSCAPARRAFREKGEEPEEELELRRRLGALGRAHRRAGPRRRRSGACSEIPVDLDEVYRHLDTHVLFKLHWGGRGVKGEAWQTLLREDFRPRLERMWREQDYLHPRALLGFFPCYALGNEIVVLDPEDRETRADALRLPAPARRATASAWPTSSARPSTASRPRSST